MIGIKGVPKGIKTTIYNFVEAIEVEGFVPWFIQETEKKKKKTHQVIPMTLIENYHTDNILKRCGWDILKSWLVLDEENLIIKSQFFAQRGIRNEENDHFEETDGMEEEEADLEECESEEVEDIHRRDLKAVKFENEEKQLFNNVEVETRLIMMNKVKKIAIPKLAHELNHQKVYDKISFGIFIIILGLIY